MTTTTITAAAAVGGGGAAAGAAATTTTAMTITLLLPCENYKLPFRTEGKPEPEAGPEVESGERYNIVQHYTLHKVHSNIPYIATALQ